MWQQEWTSVILSDTLVQSHIERMWNINGSNVKFRFVKNFEDKHAPMRVVPKMDNLLGSMNKTLYYLKCFRMGKKPHTILSAIDKWRTILLSQKNIALHCITQIIFLYINKVLIYWEYNSCLMLDVQWHGRCSSDKTTLRALSKCPKWIRARKIPLNWYVDKF